MKKVWVWFVCTVFFHDYWDWEYKWHPFRAESVCKRCGKKGIYL